MSLLAGLLTQLPDLALSMESRLPEPSAQPPTLSDKDVLELSLALSSLVYADHYLCKSLELLTNKLHQLGLLPAHRKEEIIALMKLDSIQRKRSSINTHFVPLNQVQDIRIGFFYKSRRVAWRDWVGRFEKPSGVILCIFDEVIIAFRGTSKYNLKSSLNNFNLRHSRIAAGNHAHRGFVRKLHQASNGYETVLKAMIGDGNQVITFTGHSNGGAQAMIAALEMALDLRSPPLNIRRVITWAGVSGLYGGTVNSYNAILGQRTLQVVNEKDSLAKLMDVLGVKRVLGLLLIRISEEAVNADPHDRVNSYLPILHSLVNMDDATLSSTCQRAVQDKSFTIQLPVKL